MNVDLKLMKDKLLRKEEKLASIKCFNTRLSMGKSIKRIKQKIAYFEKYGRFPNRKQNLNKNGHKESSREKRKRQLKNRFNCRCFYCNRLDTVIKFNIDHYYPKSKYKQSDDRFYSKSGVNRNYVYSCTKCNGKKKDMEPLEFADYCARSKWFTNIRDFC